jgi:hypothetical protein
LGSCELGACRPACRREDHLLARLVTAWPRLPADVQSALVLIAESSRR